jgi:hypothetical protein
MQLLPGVPRFLGYIPQRFRVYGGDVASVYAKYLPRIDKAIASDLIAVLRKVGATLAPRSSSESELGQVKDFGTIATASQVQGMPMKNVTAGTPSERAEAEKAFVAIAEEIISRTR